MKTLFVKVIVTACVVFTVLFAISLPFAYIYGGESEGLNMCVGMLVAGLAAAALQGFWFSGVFMKQTRYAVRLAGFALTCAPVMFTCGWVAGWIPQKIEFVGSFLLIFIVIFAIVSIGYSIYFKRTAGTYQQALENYRRKVEHEG